MDSEKTSNDGADDMRDHDSRSPSQENRNRDLEKNEPEKPEKDEAFLVKWEENEKNNPRNWSNAYKAFITLQCGLLACVTMRLSWIFWTPQD